MTAKSLIARMESLRNEREREGLTRFFKTAPGQYGHGDEFLGIRVPQTRQMVKECAKDFPLDEVPELLHSRWHEVRLCGLLILVEKFARAEKEGGDTDAIVAMYLRHAERANNWDLVDLSAPKILGRWLALPTRLGDKQEILDRLATSGNLWKERISMVCTLGALQQGNPMWTLRYAEVHLHHPHDLMHKAVGWMLREMGKRVSMDLLRDFLRQHAPQMPRTALRYAIERMAEPERRVWMKYEASQTQERQPL